MTSRSAKRSLADRKSGTVTIEFAMIATAFLSLLIFALQLGFRSYAQIALDFATIKAARTLAVDSQQKLSGSRSGFQTATFCPLLAPFLKCSNVLIALRPISSDYISDSQTNPPTITGTLTLPSTFSAGGSGSLMLLQVTYLGPTLAWPYAWGGTASYNGATGSALVASAPYENEY